MKTIFLDIDGTIFKKYPGGISNIIKNQAKILPDVRKTLDKWESRGYNIILVTGRPESLRELTESQLIDNGVYYDRLIMGLKGHPRVLINDTRDDGITSADSVEVERNTGLSDLSDI